MCKCDDIEIGSYDNQVMLPIPNHMENYRVARREAGLSEFICIDKCLEEEIKYLWHLGIKTTGCCCGHNKQDSFIGVFEEDEHKMLQLGYKVQSNQCDLTRTDSFYARSI